MRAGTQRRIKLFAGITGLAALAGVVFGVQFGWSTFPQAPIAGAIFGAVAGSISGSLFAATVAGVELLLPATRTGRRLERAPFLVILTVKFVLYAGALMAISASAIHRWIAAYLVWGRDAAPAVVQSIHISFEDLFVRGFLISSVLSLLIQFSRMVGPTTLRDILLSRYNRARAEERFFLFVDIVGSTPLAEKLGPASVHAFLGRVFETVSDSIDLHKGDVYQYVGDEVVVTWTLAQGCAEARPIACYHAMVQALAAESGAFRREFGAVPALRAALHAGTVITGEIGGSRRAIVFHGDVMNTTSRIENATRELQQSFLISEDALQRLQGKEAYRLADLGPQQLRGRAAPIRLYAVAPASSGVV